MVLQKWIIWSLLKCLLDIFTENIWSFNRLKTLIKKITAKSLAFSIFAVVLAVFGRPLRVRGSTLPEQSFFLFVFSVIQNPHSVSENILSEHFVPCFSVERNHLMKCLCSMVNHVYATALLLTSILHCG